MSEFPNSKPEHGPSRVEQAVINQVQTDYHAANEAAVRARKVGEPVDQDKLDFARGALKFVDNYFSNIEKTHEVYGKRGYDVNNFSDYAFAVIDEKTGVLDALHKEAAGTGEIDDELADEIKRVEDKLAQVKYVANVYKAKQKEAVTFRMETTSVSVEEGTGDWDLLGDKGLEAQIAVLDRLRNEKDGVKLIMNGLGNIENVPLAQGKSPEELRLQVDYLGYIEDTLLRFSPESGQSIHDWYEKEFDVLQDAFGGLDGDPDSEEKAKILQLKQNALSRAYWLLVEKGKK